MCAADFGSGHRCRVEKNTIKIINHTKTIHFLGSDSLQVLQRKKSRCRVPGARCPGARVPGCLVPGAQVSGCPGLIDVIRQAFGLKRVEICCKVNVFISPPLTPPQGPPGVQNPPKKYDSPPLKSILIDFQKR